MCTITEGIHYNIRGRAQRRKGIRFMNKYLPTVKIPFDISQYYNMYRDFSLKKGNYTRPRAYIIMYGRMFVSGRSLYAANKKHPLLHGF